LTQECRARCHDHSWPGNVRELQMVASVFASGTVPDAPAAVLDSAERMWGERSQGEA
jgi:DNA-binding NtrC family response regulator